METFTLTNSNGMTAKFTNYGARLMSLFVPAKDGQLHDVVLGFESPEEYLRERHLNDLGATVGRYANRIAGGRMTIDGHEIQLPQNDGTNCLHGGPTGWQYQLWEVENVGANTLTLGLTSPDGDNGFPGTVRATVTFTLEDNNTLDIQYHATTDAPTVINMTNHSYFNLNCDNGSTSIINHKLQVNAYSYFEVDENFIPLPDDKYVLGTPFNFIYGSTLVYALTDDDKQIQRAHGIDHCFVLTRMDPMIVPCAKLVNHTTGIALEVFTTEPGLQVYTGNFLDGSIVGKHGVAYQKHSAICLETQKFPDSPNRQWRYSNATLLPGKEYTSRTKFHFGIIDY